MTSPKKAVISDENREESRRLRAIWEASGHGLTQAEFGERYEIGKQAAVGFFLSGNSAISMKAAKGFAKGLNCKISEFSTRLADEVRELSLLSNVSPVAMGATPVPLISYVQAGMLAEAIDNFQPGDADSWMFTNQRVSRSTFALEIKGKSMLPKFEPGDRVIIDPELAPQPGDYVVAKNGDEEATFKKYRPRGTDASGNLIFELVPLNEDFPTIRSDTQPLRIVGTMVEYRKFRKPALD